MLRHPQITLILILGSSAVVLRGVDPLDLLELRGFWRMQLVPEIPRDLRVEPKLRTRPERGFEAQRSVRRNPALAFDDVVHTLQRNIDRFGEVDLSHAKWAQELP